MRSSERTEPLRILVVEDESLIAAEIVGRLGRLGFDIVGEADTGERAIEAAARTRPDLVLMDVRLKGPMDGIQAAATIVKDHAVPVVFLTAHSDRETVHRAKGTDPFGYVLKPFHERDLVVAIDLALHRHGLETRLKESEQKFSTTLASIGDGVIATDPISRITYLNRVAEGLTGWNSADARGLPIDQVFPILTESTRELRENPIVAALKSRTTVHLNEPVILVTRNREYIPIDDSAAPILAENGRILGAVVVFRDIRQRRLTENALREAEAQLRQQQKLEAIGRLAGGVAHDFNNLLTVINGFTELLLEGHDLDETSRNLLREIRRAGDRSSNLTKQLLAFGRKQIVQPAAVDLGALVMDILRLIQRLIGEDIELTTGFSPNLWTVHADPGQVEQIVMNLAVNARDAMPTGGRLRIETANVEVGESSFPSRPEVRPGRYVLLTVTDTGTGMDLATQEQIFEPFFTTKAPGKGTGLGLATVYGIVKQSEGFVVVASELGAGTTFKIYMPAVLDTASPAEKPAVPGAVPGGTETVLIVEDDDAVRSLTSSALRMHGYTVLAAENGDRAIEIFRERADEIQMVVSDVIMPGLSGRETIEAILAIRPGVRVLFLSGYTEDSVLRRGIRTGEVDFLQKPFTLNKLAAKVRESLDASGSGIG